VSLDADPSTGIAFYYGGSWNTPYNPVGGTSVSSPLFGAALTELDQFLGKRSGLEAQTLYAQFAKKGYKSAAGNVYFHDITSGGNGLDSSGYNAKKGYDQATGLGSAVWNDILTK
jgi:subtilase family serine protease